MKTLVFFLIVAAGGAYGYVSALQNRNPYPIAGEEGMPASEVAKVPLGKAWQPSPAWLPSYLVCTVWKRAIAPRTVKGLEGAGTKESTVVGIGLKNRSDRGYKFANSMAKTEYSMTSSAVGAVMGLIVAVMASLAAGWVTPRKPPKPPEKEAG
ncbi:MAG: hypothetical protein GWP05_08885 [Anaerolineaceae bacterium]|nr:hypothetical protein [Anaerolineaceae bacterium]